jgi:hypothetical protein
MRVLRPAERFIRVLHRLFRVFVPGEVIALPVTRRRGTMGVRSLLVKLCGSLM